MAGGAVVEAVVVAMAMMEMVVAVEAKMSLLLA